MAWTLKLLPKADKDLDSLDPPVARRILDFLYGRVAKLEDPRQLGEALQGSELRRYWRYRVGDYRVLCQIKNAELLILVVRIGHRREVYR